MVKLVKKLIGCILIVFLGVLLLIVLPIIRGIKSIIYRFKSAEGKRKERERREKIEKEWKEHLKKRYEEILSAVDIPKCQKMCNEIEELTGIKIDFPTNKKQ